MIINEPSFTSDELRIIAKDAKSLSTQDRRSLMTGADQLEQAQRELTRLHSELSETKQHLQAMQDKKQAYPFMAMGFSNKACLTQTIG
jgi:hypothetical protein